MKKQYVELLQFQVVLSLGLIVGLLYIQSLVISIFLVIVFMINMLTFMYKFMKIADAHELKIYELIEELRNK